MPADSSRSGEGGGEKRNNKSLPPTTSIHRVCEHLYLRSQELACSTHSRQIHDRPSVKFGGLCIPARPSLFVELLGEREELMSSTGLEHLPYISSGSITHERDSTDDPTSTSPQLYLSFSPPYGVPEEGAS